MASNGASCAIHSHVFWPVPESRAQIREKACANFIPALLGLESLDSGGRTPLIFTPQVLVQAVYYRVLQSLGPISCEIPLFWHC